MTDLNEADPKAPVNSLMMKRERAMLSSRKYYDLNTEKERARKNESTHEIKQKNEVYKTNYYFWLLTINFRLIICHHINIQENEKQTR